MPHDNVGVPAPMPALILVAGLAAFGARIVQRVRTRARSRCAERMMARTLEASVKRENKHQAVAALRIKRNDVQPLEAESDRTELLRRIERIRVHVLKRSVDRETRSQDARTRRLPPSPGVALSYDDYWKPQVGSEAISHG
jgi:hypothetical protein